MRDLYVAKTWLKHGNTLIRHGSVLAGYALVGHWQSVTHPPRFNGVVKAIEKINKGKDYTKIGNLDII